MNWSWFGVSCISWHSPECRAWAESKRTQGARHRPQPGSVNFVEPNLDLPHFRRRGPNFRHKFEAVILYFYAELKLYIYRFVANLNVFQDGRCTKNQWRTWNTKIHFVFCKMHWESSTRKVSKVRNDSWMIECKTCKGVFPTPSSATTKAD